MNRRPRRPSLILGLESLEQRQMLHGGVATQPAAGLLRMVDAGQAEDDRASLRSAHLAAHEKALHAQALRAGAEHHGTVHAQIMPTKAAHAAIHAKATHHAKPVHHAKATHHAKPAHHHAAHLKTTHHKAAAITTTTSDVVPVTLVGAISSVLASPAVPVATTPSPATSSPTANPTAPANPTTPPVISAPIATQALAIGSVLDTKIVPGGVAGPGVAYIITPQPLPANMVFDRTTGELTFTPAPGQAGDYRFTVTTSGGATAASQVVAFHVSNTSLATTEVSGRVVDEAGQPLAGMPVAIGGSSATTDSRGNFTLAAVPAFPGPINAGGALATAQDRQGLLAPLDQLLGHELYPNANNVIAQPLILPKIDWSTAATFGGTGLAKAMTITNPAMPGFAFTTVPGVSGSVAASGTVRLAQLPAAVSAQHFPAGVSGGLFLYEAQGIDLTKPVVASLPNTGHFQPGATLQLLKLNVLTGGHDVVGTLVVSADGKTMTTTGPVVLAHPAVSSAATTAAAPSPGSTGTAGGPAQGGEDPVGSGSGSGSGSGGGPTYTACLEVVNSPAYFVPNFTCQNCDGSGGSGDSVGSAAGAATGAIGGMVGFSKSLSTAPAPFDSDAGLITGRYLLDHQIVPYQSQGQERGIDLQYSSDQAAPRPVAEYQLTLPIAGNSSSITSITAQVTLAGVSQGAAATYNTPNGLTDGATYNIPVQVDGSALASGSYAYTMTVSEHFGSGMGSYTITTGDEGNVDVLNRSTSPYGGGWSIGDLQGITQATAGGPALVTAGQQGFMRFDPVYSGGGYLQDLAASSTTTGAAVLANDGTGSFPTGIDNISGTSTVGMASGDLNGDGKPDLSLVGPTTLIIGLNNGSGGFGNPTLTNLPSGYVSRGVVMGNFTGHSNGVLDLAVLLASTGTGAYSVAEYTGAGDGTFAAPILSAAGPGNGSYNSGRSGANTFAVGDYNGDGRDDLAFTTDDGLADVMLSTGGGHLGSAAPLVLPAGFLAIGLAKVDYNNDGKADLVVQVNDTNMVEPGLGFDGTFVGLNLFTGDGNGGFAATSSYLTNGHPDLDTLGIVAGAFNGTDVGLEVAVPITPGDRTYLSLVPLSPAGQFSPGNQLVNGAWTGNYPSQPGNIIAGDLDGSGKPSIALTEASNQVRVFLADPDSNATLPVRTYSLAAGTGPGNYAGVAGLIAIAPFTATLATQTFRGTPSETSTLVHNGNGTWTRSYPDGTVLQFDSAGREVSQTDRNGNATTYAYVPAGQAGAGALQSVTDPVGLATTLAYNSSGKLQTITDPAGRVTTATVDSNGNLAAIADPDGAIEGYGYANPSNHLATTETNPDGNTATAHYNTFGQVIGETLFGNTATTNITPAQSVGLAAPGSNNGILCIAYQSSLTDADGLTITRAYSRASHPMSVVDATGAKDSYTYSSRGFVASATDPLNRTTSYTYDSLGNVTSITQPALGYGPTGGSATTESIAYNDPYSVPTSITDFLGLLTTFMLDAHGNILRRTDPDGLHEDWTYNAAGQPLTDTSRAGKTTTYTYDARGRASTITYPGATNPVTFAYDPAGNILSETDELGHTSVMTYDQAGRLLSTTKPDQAIQTVQAGGPGFSTTGPWSLYPGFGHGGSLDEEATNQDGSSKADFAFAGLVAGQQYSVQVTWPTYSNRATNAPYSVSDGSATLGTATINQQVAPSGVTDPSGTPWQSLGTFSTATGQLTVELSSLANGRVEADAVRIVPVVATPPPTQTVQAGGSGFSTTGPWSLYPGFGHGGSLDEEATNQDGSSKADFAFAGLVAGQQYSVQVTWPTYSNRATNAPYSVSDGSATLGTATINQQVAPSGVTDPSGTPWQSLGTFSTATGQLTVELSSLANGRVEADAVRIVPVVATGATRYAYDPDGKLLSVTDPLGNATSFTYNARDELATMTDAAHQATNIHASFGYDPYGNLLSATDMLGHTSSVTYENGTLHTTSTDGAGDITTYNYDLAGELISKIDPNQNQTGYTYDPDGNLRSVTRPGIANPTGPGSYSGGYQTTYSPGATSTYGYDPDRNLVSELDPLNHSTTLAYNKLNLPTGATDALTHTTGATYDADLNQASSVDGLGHATTMTYDSRDRLISETQPTGGGTTSYTYDDANNLLTVTDPDNNVTRYTYDSDNRVITETMPTGGVTRYVYDLAGNLSRKIDALGRTIQYGHDADNREISETWLPAGGGPAVYTMRMTYDAAGRVASAQDNSSKYAYGYDNADRLTSINNAGTPGVPQVTLTYGYDADGNRTSLADSLGGTVAYAYDARNELDLESQSGSNGSGISPELALMVYDQAGNLTGLARFADLAANTKVAATAYGYDAANRLTSLAHQNASGSTIASYGYTLDAANRLTSLAHTWNGGSSTDTVTYGYTNNDQLTSVAHSNASFAGESFSFDSNGNRNASGQTTGTGNEVSSDGTYNYTYDADGNLATKTAIATGVQTIYTWDFRNRLIEVQQVAGGTTTTLALYTYDAVNNEIVVVEGGVTRSTLYDGQTPLLDFNGSGTVTARYLSVPGAIDELLARQTSSGVAWYLDDREGSVGDIVNNSGSVIDHIDYSAFGVAADSSPANGDRFKYAGMEYDAAIRLYYDRARWYDPVSGRYVSIDPSGFTAGDADLFRYAANGPTNHIDLSGLSFTNNSNGTVWVYTAEDGWRPCVPGQTLPGDTDFFMYPDRNKDGSCTAFKWIDPYDVTLGADGGIKFRWRPGQANSWPRWFVSVTPGVCGIAQFLRGGWMDPVEVGIGLPPNYPPRTTPPAKPPLPPYTCFTAGTQIHTKEGLKRIEEVSIADLVLAWDEASGKIDYRPVLRLIKNKSDALVALRGDGWRLSCTAEHPFLLMDGTWIQASRLKPGDLLATCGSESCSILEKEHLQIEGGADVYNFEVAEYHTYCVTDRGLIVHNKNA